MNLVLFPVLHGESVDAELSFCCELAVNGAVSDYHEVVGDVQRAGEVDIPVDLGLAGLSGRCNGAVSAAVDRQSRLCGKKSADSAFVKRQIVRAGGLPVTVTLSSAVEVTTSFVSFSLSVRSPVIVQSLMSA